MIGKIYITSSGYDPEFGKQVCDPYLGPYPTLGACRPDIRERLQVGDHIFVVSGKVQGANQLVMGGFEIAEKITAREAFERFPDLRLQKRADGQITGNIIVDADGSHHKLDDHDQFQRRSQNYIVGKNAILLTSQKEIVQGRRNTLEILQEVFDKKGSTPLEIIGRCCNVTERQVEHLRSALASVKRLANRDTRSRQRRMAEEHQGLAG
jgi:hypothetical protein